MTDESKDVKWVDGRDDPKWMVYLTEEERIEASVGNGSMIGHQPYIETWQNGLTWWRCPETDKTMYYSDIVMEYYVGSRNRYGKLVGRWIKDFNEAFLCLIGEEEDDSTTEQKR